MPCNCSDVRMTACSCKLVPKSFLKSTQDLVLAHSGLVEKRARGCMFRLLEALYEQCAGYNLRYCPFRGVGKRDKSLTSAFKHLMILTCFLVANFVVFINIVTKIVVHIFYLIKETGLWISSRSVFKSECNEPFHFEPRFIEHDHTLPKKIKLI